MAKDLIKLDFAVKMGVKSQVREVANIKLQIARASSYLLLTYNLFKLPPDFTDLPLAVATLAAATLAAEAPAAATPAINQLLANVETAKRQGRPNFTIKTQQEQAADMGSIRQYCLIEGGCL